jgi:hypothetical protein
MCAGTIDVREQWFHLAEGRFSLTGWGRYNVDEANKTFFFRY